jgi:hypothetical protein
MGTLATNRGLYHYFRKVHIISDLSKRVLTGGLYYSNTNYYKAVLGQYVNFNSYIGIYNNSLKLNTVHTEADVQPSVLGGETKDVINRFGKPDFVFNESNLSVFVYKWKINGIRTRCEVHLYKNKAFLVNYIYNHLEKSQRDYIGNSITAKYLSQYTSEVDLMTTKISDRNSNILFMDNFLMGLKVTYLSNCESDWFEAMGNFAEARKARHEEKMRISEKRFFNRI